ncbi:5-methylcytosine rRNA methyltransferase NSUN4 isoform X1 [Bos taurus]|uniref:5-methylcytosine rRNA methyltransferase NSUN4 isoform X1 n=1 Tax=Bos taurus TaxID=9913 RepID=UPI0028CB711C|nr:5-methylcytosine rRNA methyltransferase NSUN4 isoform X1 [Bos taurus]XP_059740883.1 5-methylcytosine rRNA methyltransferase NSUN4 isoform X1 [Bos taurus]
MGSPHLSRAPFSGLTCSPEISSLTGQPSSLPRPILSRPPPPSSPTPQALPRPGGCFEPSSPHLGRPSCREPILSGSSPPSPCVERFRLVGSPPARQRSPHCSWISPPRTPRPCPRGPYIDQHSYLYYYGGYPPALVTNPVTSPPLTHVPLETGPVISPPLTHRSLGTGLVISPPLAHRHMETRPIISPPPQRILDTGPMTSTLLSSWSSGRSYNDPPLSSASSPPTDNFYHGHVKRPDSHEPKPQLDPTFGKNYCGSPLSSQPGTSSCPSSPQEGSYHYSHLPPEAHIPAPGNPYYAIHLSPGSTGNPQLQDSKVGVGAIVPKKAQIKTGERVLYVLKISARVKVPDLAKVRAQSRVPFVTEVGAQARVLTVAEGRATAGAGARLVPTVAKVRGGARVPTVAEVRVAARAPAVTRNEGREGVPSNPKI